MNLFRVIGVSFLCLPSCLLAGIVDIYSVPPAETLSSRFAVTIDGRPVPVIENARTYTHFSFEGTVEVRITGASAEWVVSPRTDEVESRWDSPDWVITLHKPAKLVLHRAYSATEALMIFADAIDPDAPKPTDANVVLVTSLGADPTGEEDSTEAIIRALALVAERADLDWAYVPPGTYRTQNLWMPSRTRLYLAGGSMLLQNGGRDKGFILFDRCEDAGIYGRGVLEGRAEGTARSAAALPAAMGPSLRAGGDCPGGGQGPVCRNGRYQLHNRPV